MRSPLVREASLSCDQGAPICLHAGRGQESRDSYYVYVDNLGVLGVDKERVERAMTELQDIFNGLGLELHGSEINSGSVEALGCCIDGVRQQSRITTSRL